MASHLIIGLGGTGGSVIREFRKRIFEEYRSVDPGNGVYVDYVYVDSSPEDLDNRSDWKILGKSVHLGEAQKVNINGINTAILNNINQYPGLEGFMSPNDVSMVKNEMASLIDAGIGGQRRRLGRMLLANNVGDVNNQANFEKVVRSAVGRLQQNSGNQDVTFHICAGLAGGTGSGSIVDAVTLIRTWFPCDQNTKAYKIRLMLYVPENIMVNAKHDAGFYQANGYAALQELNALSVGAYKPTDIKGQKDIFSGEVQRLLDNQDAFEAAYVYTNVNEHGKTLDMKTGLPSSVANFLFQTIVVPAKLGTNGEMGRLVGCENNGTQPELDQNNKPTRSRKFLSFGITRVEYPESEIREYVSYSFAHQAALQLTYNYWVNGIGYQERTLDEVGLGFLATIKEKKNRTLLKMSNSELMLETPIITNAANKNWHTIDMTWETRLQRESDEIQQNHPKASWLGRLSDRSKVFYDTDYRNNGVENFYAIQQKEIKGYAAAIRRHIEELLFNDWQAGGTGGKSMLEIEKYVSLLKEDSDDRIVAFDQQIEKVNEAITEAENEMKDANDEWNNIGWITDTFTTRAQKTFAKYKSALQKYYSHKTRIHAYNYAKQLLQQIIIELTNLSDGVMALRNRINEVCKFMTEMAGQKCDPAALTNDSAIKQYDPTQVRNLVKQYITTQNMQSGNAATIRNRFVEKLGVDGVKSFANLYDKLDQNTMESIILDSCESTAIKAMEDTATKDPLNKMVGVNILEKLKQELTDDNSLETFVKNAVQSAGAYVQFDQAQRAQATTMGAMQHMIQLCLPAATDGTQQFRQNLINKFKNTYPGFSDSDCILHNNPSQIIVVSAYAGFPLRFILNLGTLKDKYDRLLASAKGDFNRMVLHTESFSKDLPALFSYTPEQLKQMTIKPLMLAFTLQLIQEKVDPSNGKHFLAMKGTDEFGNDTWMPMGKDFASSWNALSQDYPSATQLMDKVEAELKTQARTNDQKAELKQRLGQVLNNEVKISLCENNEFHPDYNKYKAVAIDILNNELKPL